MKKAQHWILVGILMGVALITVTAFSASTVRAEDPAILPTDAGIVGEDWRLPEGATYEGDVAVLGGNAYVEKGGGLYGDLGVGGGNGVSRGKGNGEVRVIGGNLEVRGNGAIHGDVGVTGGRILRDPTAVITGHTEETGVFNAPELLPPSFWKSLSHLGDTRAVVSVPPPGSPEWVIYYLWRLITGVLGVLLTALVFGAIAAIIESVWPQPTTNVVHTLIHAPVANFLIGLSVLIAVLIISVLLIITLCLSPFGALLLLGLLAAWLLGWTAMGRIVGRRVWNALNLKNDVTVLPTAVGAFLLALLAGIPCIGHLFGLIIGSIGLGAVVLSSFGTQRPENVRANEPSVLPPTE